MIMIDIGTQIKTINTILLVKILSAGYLELF